jgi:uncharacterized protein
MEGMRFTWLTEKAVARALPSGQSGVFAVGRIAPDETVAVFSGSLMDGGELSALPDVRRSRSIQVEEDLFLVPGESVEPGDLINHSCEPTCGLRGSSILVALRQIGDGDEITYEYATSDGDPYDEFECLCGSPRCRGFVRGSDWKLPEIQERYRGWFSPYLERRITGTHFGGVPN